MYQVAGNNLIKLLFWQQYDVKNKIVTNFSNSENLISRTSAEKLLAYKR